MSMTLEPVYNDAGALIGLRERTPRFRYFQKGNGPMFSWTTERFDGLYASFVHIPTGKGSRSDKAVHWVMVDESLSAHELRKDAKARALRLYEEWLAGEKEPWK